MTQARTVVFDNEAVQALSNVAHGKHRRVLAVVEAVAAKNMRKAGSVRLVVPAAVRVEAGWDRRMPRAAAINRLRMDDLPLDTVAADRAAAVRTQLGVSVANAHLAASVGQTTSPHAVVTSDVGDMRRMAAALGVDLRIVPV